MACPSDSFLFFFFYVDLSLGVALTYVRGRNLVYGCLWEDIQVYISASAKDWSINSRFSEIGHRNSTMYSILSLWYCVRGRDNMEKQAKSNFGLRFSVTSEAEDPLVTVLFINRQAVQGCVVGFFTVARHWLRGHSNVGKEDTDINRTETGKQVWEMYFLCEKEMIW